MRFAPLRQAASAIARACAVTLVLTLAAHPPVVAAQALPPQEPTNPLPPTPDWARQFSLLALNGLFGGISAGVTQKFHGGSFRDGFSRGFAGGAVVYGGKRVVVEGFSGAGLVGRTLGATGASIIRNASEGEPSLARLILPLGPIRLYADLEGTRSVRAKLDLNAVVTAGLAFLEEDLEFDLSGSISAGAPVFVTRNHIFGAPTDTLLASGKVAEGVVFLARLPWRPAAEHREIFAHERVHVIQRDQIFTAAAEPLSAAVFEAVPGLAPLYRFVDLHPTDLAFSALSILFREYESRPWELEALYLTRE